MTRTRSQATSVPFRSESGYVLVFAMAVMLVVLTVGMRFLAVVHSRHQVSDNEKTGMQALLIADAGIQRVAQELSQDMTWNGSFRNQPFAGGTYTASITSRSRDHVVCQCEGTFGGVTRRRAACIYGIDNFGNVSIWASCYGTGQNRWDHKDRLIDSADGETETYASHRLGENHDEMSLAGVDSDLRGIQISKVEIVISGYTDKRVGDDYLEVRWRLDESGTDGQWHVWPDSDLAKHKDEHHAGRMYLDVTNDAPPGGWRWEHFGHGTDLELRFASTKVGHNDKVKLYVDCAGFRVTWGLARKRKEPIEWVTLR